MWIYSVTIVEKQLRTQFYMNKHFFRDTGFSKFRDDLRELDDDIPEKRQIFVVNEGNITTVKKLI